ncbi:MAG TPA: hypothetical protein VGY91_14780 [Chthoniobacterales bacterium]|nr:hypothetical protein [Chthoniobacterales bacterium]
MATMIGGGVEGCGPSQQPVRQSQPHLTAPTERTPSRESISNGHSVVATMIGGGVEGLRSLAAAGSPKPTPFDGADGADALQLQGIDQQWPSGRSNDDRWS